MIWKLKLYVIWTTLHFKEKSNIKRKSMLMHTYQENLPVIEHSLKILTKLMKNHFHLLNKSTLMLPLIPIELLLAFISQYYQNLLIKYSELLPKSLNKIISFIRLLYVSNPETINLNPWPGIVKNIY